jgi:hypothetical protein
MEREFDFSEGVKGPEELAELGALGEVLDAKDEADPFVSKFGGVPVRPFFILYL